MKAQSIKHYRGTALHKTLSQVAKEVTYTNWWYLVFPNSAKLAEILTGRIRPNQNKQFWTIAKEKREVPNE